MLMRIRITAGLILTYLLTLLGGHVQLSLCQNAVLKPFFSFYNLLLEYFCTQLRKI